MLLDDFKGINLKRLQELADNENKIPKAKGFWFWKRCPLCGKRVEYQSTANVSLSDINDVRYEKCSNPDCGWERVSFTNVYPDGNISILWSICIMVGLVTIYTVPWLLALGKEWENMVMVIVGFSVLGAWGLSFVLAVADEAIMGILRRKRTQTTRWRS
jgi:hypothetical protein